MPWFIQGYASSCWLGLMVFFAELDRPHNPHREPTGQPKWEAHSCRVPVRVHSSLGPGSCQRYVSMSFCFCSCTLFGESLCLMSVLAQKVPDLRRSRRLALLSSSSATLFLPFYWGYRAVYSCSSRNLDIYRGHWSQELLSMVLTWVCQNLYSRSVSMHV